MNIDKIVEVNIQISEAMSIDGGYDTILIMGPLPKAPGGRTTPDVAGYANLQDLKSAGFTSDDPVSSTFAEEHRRRTPAQAKKAHLRQNPLTAESRPPAAACFALEPRQ